MDLEIAASCCAWLTRQEPPLRRAILAGGRVAALKAGQWLQSEGDDETGLILVLEGALRLEVSVGAERDVLIGMAQAGSVFGQSRSHGGGPRIVTARAARKSAVLLLSDAALRRIAADHASMWPAYSEAVYAQLDAMVRLVGELLVLTAEARIAARLDSLAEDGLVRVSQADLAEMCGLSRKTANGVLSAMEKAGRISRAYGAIRMHAPATPQSAQAGRSSDDVIRSTAR